MVVESVRPAGTRRASRTVVAAALLAVALALSLLPVGAQSAEEGRAIFQEKCAACHTVGGGPLVGPDLEGVTAKRERAWLVRWLSAPDRMLAAGDPTATRLLQEFKNVPMPNQGLTEVQVASVIAYLEERGGTAAASAGPPAAALPPGDPIVGKALFTGTVRFRNGGPPCMACHSVAGIGALGGGALGPDLTAAYEKFGRAGTASVLVSLPFPTMNPIFRDRLITPEEQAHLAAFLGRAAAERPTQVVGRLVLLAMVGAAALLALAHLLWRRRLGSVRAPMVGRRA